MAFNFYKDNNFGEYTKSEAELKTSEFKALLLDDPTHKFGLENYSKGKDINDSDYIFMNKFKECKSYFESDNIEDILEKII